MEQKIVFATGNEGKMREVRLILQDLGFPVLSMKEAGVSLDIEENGTTFAENAMIKARAVWEKTGGIVLADDSGLVVDYLGGEPGVYSARYLGEDTSYEIKNQAIIDRLADAKEVEGLIAHEPAGNGGFGYDPIFYLPEYGVTSAEIPIEKKNEISHRGKALEAMKIKLRERL